MILTGNLPKHACLTISINSSWKTISSITKLAFLLDCSRELLLDIGIVASKYQIVNNESIIFVKMNVLNIPKLMYQINVLNN